MLLSSSFIFPQHSIVLKSGEKLRGKITELKNSKITFLFKGNTMTINQSDVSAIYFDENARDAKPNTKKLGSLSGVITYFFNDNYGDKPDVGADIYIIDKKYSRIDSSAFIAILGYQAATNLRESRSLLGIKNSEDDEKSFDESDAMADSVCSVIKSNTHTIKLVADGNGAYSRQLEPGFYSILIVSKHRSNTSKTEGAGKVYLEILWIQANNQYSVNAEFKPH